MPTFGAPPLRRPRAAGSAMQVREDERGAEGDDDRSAAPLVLVVDDVDDNRDLYTEYLKHEGLRVAEACDGQEALERIAEEEPDVVIMDLGMPRMDGWEATRLIKANPRTKHIPVLVLTGFATQLDLDRALAAGANALATKPFTPRDLLARVRKLIEEV